MAVFLIRAAALFLFAMLVLAQVASTDPANPQSHRGGGSNGGGRMQPQGCSPACAHRCSQTQYHKACITYCNLCCQKCLCVPPGFYGNKQVCPCYANMKTKRGGPKCP